jgi:trk system potassium uptake protein TrkA
VNIIIAGDGKVGAALTRQLSAEGYDLTLIDSNLEVLERSMEEYDVMAVQGNCASMDVLTRAGVQDADLLIAATSADEVNLLCCMTAHGINPKLHTIARIRNPEYTDQIYEMRDLFALSLMVNPERQAAAEIERLLKYPGFLKREAFAKGRMEIVELRLDAKNKLCNVPLREMNSIVRCKVLVCAVLRSGVAVAPGGDFVLHEGDRIFVTAPTNTLTVLLKNLGIITHKVNHVLIAGGGRVTFYLAQSLQKSGIHVEIVERDLSRCNKLAEILPSTTIVNGDASDLNLLDREGLAQCDALIAMTGLDELNLIISLYGKSRGVPQIITNLAHMESSSVLDSLPLGSVISPKELCSNTIVRYVRAMQNQTGAALAVYNIADGQAEAMEFSVDEKTRHCGEPLRDIKLRRNVLIAGISRGAQTEIPNGDSSFQPGDTMVIVTSGGSVIYQLNDIFE